MAIEFGISGFKNKIKSVLRPNRFSFRYNHPRMPQIDAEYWVQKVNIPKIDIKGPIIKWRGTEYNLPGDPVREYLTVTFLNDSFWEMRGALENIIHDTRNIFDENNEAPNFFNSQGYDAIITQYDDQNEVAVEFIFKDVIPLEISGIALDQTSRDSFETFDVVFYYSTYEREVN